MKLANQWIRLVVSISISVLVGVVSTQAFAQENTMEHLRDSSLGFELNSFNNDAGFGLVYTSSYSQHHLAYRVHYSQNLFRGIPVGKTKEITAIYSDVRLGVVGVSNDITQGIRLYGEGGLEDVLPDTQISSKSELGAYGLLGFEFFIHGHNPILRSSYYIELGASGTVANAEKITGNPGYLPGFTISTGWKYYY